MNKIQKERINMEENKMVEKSGLPVVINGVELTEKDLHCVASRLQELWRVQFMREDRSILFSNCETCSCAGKCDVGISDVFRKLSQITGVPMTLFCGPKGMCIPGNFDQKL